VVKIYYIVLRAEVVYCWQSKKHQYNSLKFYPYLICVLAYPAPRMNARV